MKLFNSSFNNGGLPVFNNDLNTLQDTSIQFGITSMFPNVSMILSGCRVTDCNIDTLTMSISAGKVLIGGIIYDIPAITNQSFPFSITNNPSTIVPDDRSYQTGGIHNVANDYSDGWKISTDIYNDSYINGGIEFNPFPFQRIEFIQEALNHLTEPKLFLRYFKDRKITMCESGNSIINSNIGGNNNGILLSLNNQGKMELYSSLSINSDMEVALREKVLRNGKIGSYNSIGTTGSDYISPDNLPVHNHAHRDRYLAEGGTLPPSVTNIENLSPSDLNGNIGSGSTDFNNTQFVYKDSVTSFNDTLHTPFIPSSIEFEFYFASQYKLYSMGFTNISSIINNYTNTF